MSNHSVYITVINDICKCKWYLLVYPGNSLLHVVQET